MNICKVMKMKRVRISYIVVIMIFLCFIITSCSNNPKEIIIYSLKGQFGIHIIENKKQIKEIKSIVENIKYTDEEFDIDLNSDNDPFFANIWFEIENKKYREWDFPIYNDTDNDSFIIHNAENGKFGIIKKEDKYKLIEIMNVNNNSY